MSASQNGCNKTQNDQTNYNYATISENGHPQTLTKTSKTQMIIETNKDTHRAQRASYTPNAACDFSMKGPMGLCAWGASGHMACQLAPRTVHPQNSTAANLSPHVKVLHD
eukprot:3342608-Amphidinium_carterae.1